MVRALPPSRRLPFLWTIHRIEGGLEPEVRSLQRLPIRRETAVDVGANVGLYAYVLAKQFRRVIAFEANESLLAPLRRWGAENVRVIAEALSDHAGEAVLRVPVVNGIELSGWASLEGNALSTETVERRCRTERLDSYALADVSFIKIDVEGHELPVLRGAVETIRRCRPAMLVEVRPDTAGAVRDFLAGLGYTEASWEAATGTPASPDNAYFVPAEAHVTGIHPAIPA